MLGIERRSRIRPTWGQRWRAWRSGRTSVAFALYELDRNDPSGYRLEFADIDHKVLGPHRGSINDKLAFTRQMQGLGVLVPEPLAYVRKGKLSGLSYERRRGEEITLSAMASQSPRSVWRPVGLGGGRGVSFVTRRPEGWFQDGESVAEAELETWIASLDEYLATEFVDQAEYARTIFPDSPNTLRILTLWDPSTNKPFIAAAAHRFGSSASGHLDNFHQGFGGVSVPIDIQTGVLGPAARLTERGEVLRLDEHPDSGAQIAGIEIPGWDEIAREVLEVAAALPECSYVGWDLLPTEAGPYWLEGNSPPGLWVWQVHGPLMTDPRTQAFFSEPGVVRRR